MSEIKTYRIFENDFERNILRTWHGPKIETIDPYLLVLDVSSARELYEALKKAEKELLIETPNLKTVKEALNKFKPIFEKEEV